MSAYDDLVAEPTPTLPHVAGEFLLWLWWLSERTGGRVDAGGEHGVIEVWMDTRIAFRHPGEGKAAAILTGENPSTAREARATLAGGKVLREARIGLRREEREFYVTLRSPYLELTAMQLPQVVKGPGDEALYDRMALYEELHDLIRALFRTWARARSASTWEEEVVGPTRAWIREMEALEDDAVPPDDGAPWD